MQNVRLLSATAVRQMCGNISDMTLWRWQQDDDLNMPRPIRISKRRYFREAEILAWLEAQAEKAEVRA